MKKLSKILILLLSVALVCTGLILAVSASDDVGTPGASYVNANGETVTADNLSDAFANAKEGTTITLTGNTTVSSTISPTKTITLDLGGYTLTNKVAAFKPQTDNTTFTITGEGNIVSSSQLIAMKGWSASDVRPNRNVSIIGTGRGINITYKNSETATDGKLFVMDAGVWTFSNLNIDATFNRIDSSTKKAKSEQLFYCKNLNSTTGTTLYLNFTAVTINAASNSMESAVIHGENHTKTTMKYCDIKTNGACAFICTKSNATSDYIVIENSRIDIAYYEYSEDSKASNEGTIFRASNNVLMNSNIIVKDSYLSALRPSLYSNAEDKAIVLENSTYNVKTANSAFKSANVLLKSGSAITYGKALSSIYSEIKTLNYPTVDGVTIEKNMILFEGSRICGNVYKALQQESDGVGFIDGSVPNAEDAGYVFAYDPIGNSDAPYVVVKRTFKETVKEETGEIVKTETTVKDYVIADSSILYYSNNPSLGNYGTGHTAVPQSFYGNTARKMTFFASSGARPEAVNTIQAVKIADVDIVVLEFDLATDADYMADGTFQIYARKDSQGNHYYSGYTVDRNGVVSFGTNKYQLDLSSWNRVTVVIDTKTDASYGTAHYYFNGVYLGGDKCYKNTATTINGFRMSFNGFDTDESFIIDNLTLRAYGSGQGTSSREHSEYLTNGGKPTNKTRVNDSKVAPITIGTIGIDSLNDVPTYINDSGNKVTDFIPKVNSTVFTPQFVDYDGVVYSNGNVINLTSNSYGCLIDYDVNGNPIRYTFSSSYNAKINFVFSYDGITSDIIKLGMGNVPSEFFNGTAEESVEKRDGHWQNGKLVGWYYICEGENIDADMPITIEIVEALKEQNVTLYPVYVDYYQYYAWVIEDADGNFLRGGDQLNFWDADWKTRDWAGNNKAGDKAAHLYSGQTFVVQKDNLYFVTQVNPKNTSAEGGSDTNPEVFNFDLNGHYVLSDWRQNSDNPASYGTFQPAANDTYNIFSSRPGGYLVEVGQVKGTGAFAGGDLFRMQVKNAHINVGDVTINGVEYNYGENLTVNGNAIVRLHGTAEGSTVNIKGTTLIRGLNYNNALIYTRGDGDTDGAISATTNVTNCTIIITGEYLFNTGNSKSYYNTIFDGCTIITNENAKSLINNLTSKNSVTFNNCVTNGKIKTDGKTNTGNVIVKDTASALNAYAAPTGYVNAEWNVPMSLGEGVETIIAHILSRVSDDKNSKIILTPYVIAISSSDAEANLTLGNLAIKTVETSEAVTVTYKGIGENNDLVKYYAKGGNVKAFDLPAYNANAFVLTHTGEFNEAFATNIQEAATYTPVVTATSNVTGLQANVSLYADFGINLYIPAKYDGLVTVDGKALVSAINGTYLKATELVKCDKAADAVTFTINVAETIDGTKYTDTCSVTISLLDYASAVLGGEYKNSDKVLVYYMMNYANEAVNFFGEGAEDIAKLVADNKEAIEAIYAVDSTLKESEIISSMGITPAITDATIDLGATPAFAFKIADGFVGTITVSYAKGLAERVITVGEGFDYETYVKVDGMKAYNFGTVLTISINGTLGEEEINVENGKFSLETYVNGVAADAEHADLVYALRAYAEVSEGYKTGALKALLDAPAGEGEVA